MLLWGTGHGVIEQRQRDTKAISMLRKNLEVGRIVEVWFEKWKGEKKGLMVKERRCVVE